MFKMPFEKSEQLVRTDTYKYEVEKSDDSVHYSGFNAGL